ncbi:MAG: SH3 domain-containing protein [Treponema sp.]|nr:SH3 domain-containing protein [Treponema sp.]
MRKIRVASLLFAAALALALASCFSSVDSSIKLPPTPLLSRGPGWIVVKTAYARVKEKPSRASNDLAHVRGGGEFEIFAVDLGDTTDPNNGGPWYRIKTDGLEGWIEAADLDVFSSRAQADYAAAHYR